MRAAEIFERYGNTWNIRVAAHLGSVMDEIEGKLDKLRQANGLSREWLPIHTREQSVPVNSPVTWSHKARSCNGMGDLITFASEFATGLDIVNAKLDELLAEGEMVREVAAAETPRRGPGRPRKDAA